MRTLLAVALCLGLAAPCAAAEDGVFVDPGAPTSKEYAIAFEQARRDAAGTGGQTHRHGARDAPLFGVGIQPERNSRSQSVKKARPVAPRRAPSPSAKPTKPTRPLRPAADEEPSRFEPLDVAPSSALANDGGSSTVLTIGGLTTGVLLLGAVAGSIARRRSDAT